MSTFDISMVFPSGDKCLGECFGSNNPPITIFPSRTESPSNLRSQRQISTYDLRHSYLRSLLPEYHHSLETLLYFWSLFFCGICIATFRRLINQSRTARVVIYIPSYIVRILSPFALGISYSEFSVLQASSRTRCRFALDVFSYLQLRDFVFDDLYRQTLTYARRSPPRSLSTQKTVNIHRSTDGPPFL